MIIPVYNAEKYVTAAVESALMQPETGEVVLVEDGSPDNALEICRKLAKRHENVKVFQHPDGKNRGAGASRNVGIKNASFPYIAFLDADDFFLPCRFMLTNKIFEKNPSADGVCEAMGVYFENRKLEKKYIKDGRKRLDSMTKIVPPDQMFYEMAPIGNAGFSPTDGWTFKKTSISKIGLFNEKLLLHQDTEFFVRAVAIGTIYQGSLDNPVSMRGVHDDNRYWVAKKKDLFFSRAKMWKELYLWSIKNISEDRKNIISKKLIMHHISHIQSQDELTRRVKILWTLHKLRLTHRRIHQTPYWGNILQQNLRDDRNNTSFRFWAWLVKKKIRNTNAK